jgi:lysozyme
VFGASLVSTACTPQKEPDDERLGTAQEALTVCPPSTVVSGIDIASFQHPNGDAINWTSVAKAEKFVLIKATESNDYVNSYYAGDASGAKGAGLYVGAYHFLAPSSVTGVSGTAQADYFVSHANLGATTMPPMLDVETSSLYKSVLPSAADVTSFLAEVKAKSGKTPFIYIGYYTLQDLGDPSSFTAYDIDIPDYGACPSYPTSYPVAKLIMWQNTSTASIPGITGNVDHDEFYGDLAAFQKFATGAAPDYGASYVSQSWPLASTTIDITVNQEMPASITLKNTGSKSWNSSTRLATTEPEDRASPFVGPGWVATDRLAEVSGSVAPGATHKFSFTWKAPNTPGAYTEHYGMVQEGVTWFSAPNQGGPPDNDIEAKFNVVEAQYHGAFVSQTFPTLQQPPVTLTVGQTLQGTFTIKNVGTATWKSGVTKFAPIPRDKASPLTGASWLSATRVSTPPSDVAPGASYAFPVEIYATTPGDYTEYWSLVEEGVTWFADAPLGGGPPDNHIAIHVIVTEADGGVPSTSSSSSGAGGAGGSAVIPDAGIGGMPGTGGSGGTGGVLGNGGESSGPTSGSSGGASSGGTTPSKSAGCGCRTPAGSADDLLPLAAVTLGIVALARRRRRAA